MELNKNRWYVQWFFLSVHIINCFTGNDNEYVYKRRGTNLCQFMRVTLLWAPIVVLLNLAIYGLLLSAFVFVPLHFFGVTGSLSIYGVILAIVAALFVLVLLIWGAVSLKDVVQDGTSHVAHVLRERKERKAAERAVKGPSFGSLVWQSVVATKRRFCPTITFNEQSL